MISHQSLTVRSIVDLTTVQLQSNSYTKTLDSVKFASSRINSFELTEFEQFISDSIF
jgi:hypothetical protein